jgi:enoyl-CoA hydratase/carnithine racemase
MAVESEQAGPAPVLTTTFPTPQVALLTLNRPASRNAFNTALYTALAEALARHGAASSSTRVIVLAGAGPSFCAGMDLFEAAGAGRVAQHAAARRFMLALIHCPAPVVAAAHGRCVGIGTTLLLHADAVLAADDASFSTPFAALGLPPEFASSLLLPRRLGLPLSAHLLSAGGSLSAADARRAGLAEPAAVPAGGPAALDAALRHARALCADRTDDEWEGVLAAKAAVRRAERGAVLRAVDAEFDAIHRAFRDGAPARLIARRVQALGAARARM